MNRALIGYTGFIGGNIGRQASFECLFNSKNISKVGNDIYDLVVCAAAPGEKWKANNNPKEDLASINKLIKNLSKVKANNFVLISTVDVYPNPVNVNEDSKISESKLNPYGKNRLFLEKFIQEKFKNYHIIRLPGLFGLGLKKNIIFDLINSNALDYTHKDSVFQFYDLNNLWKDIQIVLREGVRKINFSTEPVSVAELAKKCFRINFINVTERPAARYDMKTAHSSIFNKKGDYIYSKKDMLKSIQKFANSESIK